MNTIGFIFVFITVVIFSVLMIWSWMVTTSIVSGQQTTNCPDKLNTSNYTQKIWDKYCIDPQTDADYLGTSLPTTQSPYNQCPPELNTGFTERIWTKYCMETKSDAVYNGTNLNNTNQVANVMAIIDLNDEKGWYSKDNPLRLVNPYPAHVWTEEKLQCKLYGNCDIDNDNKTK